MKCWVTIDYGNSSENVAFDNNGITQSDVINQAVRVASAYGGQAKIVSGDNWTRTLKQEKKK